MSETSDGSGSTDSNCDLFIEEYDRLQEMFPESTSMEIKYCLSIANGDLESARQIIMHRQVKNFFKKKLQNSDLLILGVGTKLP